ncbi:MAG: SPOR domain-containing protein [Pseudomonadota bacterium]
MVTSGRHGFSPSHMAKILFLALTLFASAVRADFDAAADAYRNKNYPLAFSLFSPLAESGDPRAQTVIAMMYKYGESVPENQEAAFGWYLRAAQAGYAPAMFNLGDMYSRGQGTDPNLDEAVKWLTAAATAGFSRANVRLAELDAEQVSGEQVDETIPWSQSWNFRLPNEIRYGQTALASPASAATYRVQLGAMGSLSAARRLWDQLADRHPDLFNQIEPMIRLSENSARRVYRVQGGPFENLSDAAAFCRLLLTRRDQIGCLPVEPAE